MADDSEWRVAENFKSDAGICFKSLREITKNLR
jgi:hypothetical protein